MYVLLGNTGPVSSLIGCFGSTSTAVISENDTIGQAEGDSERVYTQSHKAYVGEAPYILFPWHLIYIIRHTF